MWRAGPLFALHLLVACAASATGDGGTGPTGAVPGDAGPADGGEAGGDAAADALRRSDGGPDGSDGGADAVADGVVGPRGDAASDVLTDAAPDADVQALADAGPDAGPAPDSVVPDAAPGGGDAQPSDSGPAPPDTADTASAPDAGAPPPGLCAAHDEPPWSRGAEVTGGAVTFSELMYHPPDGDLEWVELYNPFTIDADVSGWSLAGGVDYGFPPGTLIAAGGHLLVAASPAKLAAAGVPGALGPWDGKLSNGGERLELRSNGGRLMDAVDYDDSAPWPVTPDGSGLSLAKPDPLAPSPRAESWSGSAVVGGTPGAPNLPPAAPPSTFGALLPLDAVWRTSLTAPPGWQAPGFDDGAWAAGQAVFTAGGPEQGVATVRVTADNHFAVYVGAPDGADLRLVGRDAVTDWTSVEAFDVEVFPKERLFLAGWEGPGDSWSPQMIVAEAEIDGGVSVATGPATFAAVLGPPGANPGDSLAAPPPSLEAVAAAIAYADAEGSWSAPAAAAPKSSSPWGGALAGQFAGEPWFIWPDTFDGASATNAQETWALFRSETPVLAPAGQTVLPLGPTTVYFRTTLVVEDPAATALWLRPLVDDGAVFSLNGVEVFRQNMPEGPVTAATFASASVSVAVSAAPTPLPSELLVPGVNVLAVEVHQAGPDDDDMTFGAEVLAQVWAPPAAPANPGLQLSEVGPASDPWVELVNAGSVPLDLAEHALALGGDLVSLPATSLAPGERAVVDLPGAGAEPGDKLFLLGDGVLDGVELTGWVRARTAPLGPWLSPDAATPGEANVVPITDAVVISEIQFHAPPLETPGGPVASDEEWVELHNRSAVAVDVSGWQLVDGVQATLPPGATIPAGGYAVVARDPAALLAAHPGVAVLGAFTGRLSNSGETLALRDACGNPVDEVPYRDGGRWPEAADGGGSTLELRNPWLDNAIPEAWAASASLGPWQTVAWEGVAEPSAVGPDGQWQELVLGLLDAGVVLVDDVSVVEDPAGAAIPVVQDGFAGGAAAWRLLGTHRHSTVVPDPDDPANPVLRLVATGAAGHMHNHAETTLLGGAAIQNGKTYAISLRARWVSGSNRLNARLYFNRLPHTAVLERAETTGTPGAPNTAHTETPGPLFTAFGHAPPVPAPFEPVTVTAEAADSEGVAGMTLWTSVDGGPFAATPMQQQGGRWAAVTPGLPAATIVQFYVEATDEDGATSTFPAAGPASRALWKVDDGLAGATMHTVRIVMTPADADWLHTDVNLMSDDRLGATVIEDERVVHYDAGVRLKGSERGRPEPKRLGFALFFGADRPFRGVHRSVMIDRSEGVGFGQREMLMNLAMTRAGSVSGEYNDLVRVLAPRDVHTGPAELQLARFGGLFLDNQFEDGGDGTLYEYELVYYPVTTDDGTPQGLKLPQPDQVVGAPVADLGDDKERYRYTFAIDNNRWRDDYAGLIAFTKVFGQGGALLQVGAVIDVDQWLRAFAFATLSGCVDNYASGAAHNAQLYVRPADGRVLYFPHDLDFYPGSPNAPVVGASDLGKLLGSPQNRRLYYGHLWDITETSYNDAYMSHWRDQLGALLPSQPFASHHAFIVARAAWVRDGAPNAVTKAIPPVPFAVGAATPAGAGLVTVAGTGWVDVREIRHAGAPLPVTWLDETHWQAEAQVPCGASTLKLEARGHQGNLIGSDSLSAFGGDCP
ncbi:MAG: hypothetical protein AMXMBFR64_41680 [Myxococcales bacterium]